ncbi:MAG: hypothetical protein JW839_07065 [Candidatus Lokiarchaeota archaeon]|nr:hypothetical protein [Candidatus Lokiarchaeota archaeon]
MAKKADVGKARKKVPRSSWLWGFSCEFLLVKDILDMNVPQLMKELDFGLFLKMYERDFDTTFATLLKLLESLGIYDHFYPWPVLGIEDGYYPNIRTVDKFQAMIERIMAWYGDNHFPAPPYILVDIEPDVDPERFKNSEALRASRGLIKLDKDGKIIPVDPVKSNAEVKAEKSGKQQKGGGIMNVVGRLLDQIDEMSEERYKIASAKFQRLVDTMHAHGTKALCVALPITFSDLKDGKNLLQDFLATPIQSVEWDWINYMVFAEYAHAILAHDDFVHLTYTYARDFVAHHGDKASICLGTTGFGKQFHQTDPALYLQEFNACLAAGVNKLGIFCLENILALGEDEFRKFCQAVNKADGTFDPDPERLELAWKIRRLWEAVDDAVAPLLVQLVKSGRAMQLVQKFASGALK